jgi:hypothetical protein
MTTFAEMGHPYKHGIVFDIVIQYRPVPTKIHYLLELDSATMAFSIRRDVKQWLGENVGHRNWDHGNAYHNKYYIAFEHEHNLTQFLLRW